jgi:hypothetical protein
MQQSINQSFESRPRLKINTRESDGGQARFIRDVGLSRLMAFFEPSPPTTISIRLSMTATLEVMTHDSSTEFMTKIDPMDPKNVMWNLQ